MKEPTRWLDQDNLPANLRGLLEAASPPPDMPRDLHGELSRYAAGLAIQGLASKTAAGTLWSKATLSGSAIVKSIVAATLIGAAGTASYVVVGQYRERVIKTPVALSPKSPNASTAVPVVESNSLVNAEAAAPKPEPSGPTHAPQRHSSNGPARVEAASSLSASGEVSSIADEARLLESARAVLGSSPSQALEIANRHRRLHPDGQMAAEREFIAVDALLRLGRRQDAVRRADAVLDQAPNSLYGRRLRQLIGSEAP